MLSNFMKFEQLLTMLWRFEAGKLFHGRVELYPVDSLSYLNSKLRILCRVTLDVTMFHYLIHTLELCLFDNRSYSSVGQLNRRNDENTTFPFKVDHRGQTSRSPCYIRTRLHIVDCYIDGKRRGGLGDE